MFPCKTLMTVKDVFCCYVLGTSPRPLGPKLKLLTFFDKKAYLDGDIFFGFSNSEFINDNIFSLKDKKNDIRTLITNLPTST